jgi:hypothetical protein
MKLKNNPSNLITISTHILMYYVFTTYVFNILIL